ncbi:MAG TPA: hypothetical protein PLU87_11540 [Sedimentisphaerales bacterium]|nr:hypothetical protein [Sedimentisphaerales bacterium]HRS12078.1 hypothetical protein [Sedimentisphaerales bacterium]HRV48489.1 hypothetical protein [Sedimentisphaerales bacterium]
MKRPIILAAFCFLSWTGLALSSDSGRLAIAARSGTLGLGGDVMVNVLPDVNVRLSVGFFGLDFDGEVEDVEYDFDLDLLTFPLVVDWYPFENRFHLSAGVILNQTEAALTGRYDGTIEIGDETYTSDEIGALSGEVSFRDVAPYVGIGWGNAFGKARRWGFITDLGVAFTGSPDVALSASGPLADDPTFLANLAREEDDVQDQADKFKIYPVLSANLYFRF